MNYQDLYTSGRYLEQNPDWHQRESPWKAEQVLHLMRRHRMSPRTICDVGCGAGEVLAQLQPNMAANCELLGYEVSPAAMELSQSRANAGLQFKLTDIRQEPDVRFDLMLVLDVLEHVEDYFGLLRDIRPKAERKIFHIPLDLSVQTVLRPYGLLKRRDMHGHIQYFTRETALRTLEDVGFHVLDQQYTPHPIVFGATRPQRLLAWPRKLGFRLRPDATVRTMGGFSLLVLTD